MLELERQGVSCIPSEYKMNSVLKGDVQEFHR